ncbi:MAG: MBL fold metallo-hydrolase [Ignavibacteria bacterium]
MILFLIVISVIIISVIAFLNTPKFGKHPSKERLKRIQSSPNYRSGTFHNKSHTPALSEGTSYYKVFKEFFLDKKERVSPKDPIPSMKTNLMDLDINEDALIWFGHSSYYMQVDKKRILVDPVFSGSASPLSFLVKAFKGTDRYTTDNIPVIDYLFITHDHWDHLDYETVTILKPKIKKVICGLGTGEHLEYWGYDKNIIIEKDWDEEIILGDEFIVHTTPARHFSGRGFKRNKVLWLSFVLQTPSMKIFIGGDSGYDTHFRDIGNVFGEFDLAILELGQYDKKWRHIHLLPEEFLTAASELKAKRIMPVHSSKFKLANHQWDEPLKLISEYNFENNFKIITPKIGEKVNLKDIDQKFSSWWEEIK